MDSGTRVEIDMIETLTNHIDYIDVMMLNQAITAGKNSILIVDSRDSVFHFKKLCYDSSFAIPGYDLTDKFKNMMRNGIDSVYLLEHERMNEVALYFINNGIAVYILKDVDSKSILRMTRKEIERNINKESISYYKHQYLKWSKDIDFSAYPHILEDKIRELIKTLNFAAIDKNEIELGNFNAFLNDALQLTDIYYNLTLLPLVKSCIVYTLQKSN